MMLEKQIVRRPFHPATHVRPVGITALALLYAAVAVIAGVVAGLLLILILTSAGLAAAPVYWLLTLLSLGLMLLLLPHSHGLWMLRQRSLTVATALHGCASLLALALLVSNTRPLLALILLLANGSIVWYLLQLPDRQP